MLIKDSNTLVSLPEVCLRLREVLGDPDHSRKEVAQVILHDPGLSARLLRIVNSAYYGLPSAVRDVSHALGILGEHELNNLATVSAIIRSMNGLKPGFNLRAFWKTSIFAATLARDLNDCCKDASAEELFLCGLLLDIGKLPLYVKEPGLYRSVQARLERSGEAAWQIERELLGYDHSDVGAALASAWNFSGQLQQAIAAHHQLSPAGGDSTIAALMRVVSHYADQLTPADSAIGEADFWHIEPPVMQNVLGMDQQELDMLLASSVRSSQHIFDAFCGESV